MKSSTHVGRTPVSTVTNYPLHIPFKLTNQTPIVDTVIEEILKGSRHDKVFLKKTLEKFSFLFRGPVDSIVSMEKEWNRRVKEVKKTHTLTIWAEHQLRIIGNSIKPAIHVKNKEDEDKKRAF
jgi:hypothetical protein